MVTKGLWENPGIVWTMIRLQVNHIKGMMIGSTTANKLVNSVTGAGEAELAYYLAKPGKFSVRLIRTKTPLGAHLSNAIKTLKKDFPGDLTKFVIFLTRSIYNRHRGAEFYFLPFFYS